MLKTGALLNICVETVMIFSGFIWVLKKEWNLFKSKKHSIYLSVHFL